MLGWNQAVDHGLAVFKALPELSDGLLLHAQQVHAVFQACLLAPDLCIMRLSGSTAESTSKLHVRLVWSMLPNFACPGHAHNEGCKFTLSSSKLRKRMVRIHVAPPDALRLLW